MAWSNGESKICRERARGRREVVKTRRCTRRRVEPRAEDEDAPNWTRSAWPPHVPQARSESAEERACFRRSRQTESARVDPRYVLAHMKRNALHNRWCARGSLSRGGSRRLCSRSRPWPRIAPRDVLKIDLRGATAADSSELGWALRPLHAASQHS